MTSPKKYEDWIAVYSSSTDYEADMVRDRLDNADIPAVVLTQRDHSFNVNVGDLSSVHVMVPPEHEVAARKVLEEVPFTDEELAEAALASGEKAPDAHGSDQEATPLAWLDSGVESLRMKRSDVSKNDDSEEDA